MKNETSDTLGCIFAVMLLFGFIIFVGFYAQDIVYRKIEKGEVRFYDKLYTCTYKGKYKEEERFIPAEINELPKELTK